VDARLVAPVVIYYSTLLPKSKRRGDYTSRIIAQAQNQDGRKIAKLSADPLCIMPRQKPPFLDTFAKLSMYISCIHAIMVYVRGS